MLSFRMLRASENKILIYLLYIYFPCMVEKVLGVPKVIDDLKSQRKTEGKRNVRLVALCLGN